MTPEGRYNETKVQQIYEKIKTQLNKQELSFLVDKLVWDKCILLKTIELIHQDISA